MGLADRFRRRLHLRRALLRHGYRLEVPLFVVEMRANHTVERSDGAVGRRGIRRARVGVECLHGGIGRIERSQHAGVLGFQFAHERRGGDEWREEGPEDRLLVPVMIMELEREVVPRPCELVRSGP